jgi:hypothetical protein
MFEKKKKKKRSSKQMVSEQLALGLARKSGNLGLCERIPQWVIEVEVILGASTSSSPSVEKIVH